jgi:hypothetical protein
LAIHRTCASPLDARSNGTLSEDIEGQGAVVPVEEVVAMMGRVSYLDAPLIEGIDPIRSLVHEPAEGLLLDWPAWMVGDLPSCIGVPDPTCQLEKGQTIEAAEAKDAPETPSSRAMETDLLIVQD